MAPELEDEPSTPPLLVPLLLVVVPAPVSPSPLLVPVELPVGPLLEPLVVALPEVLLVDCPDAVADPSPPVEPVPPSASWRSWIPAMISHPMAPKDEPPRSTNAMR